MSTLILTKERDCNAESTQTTVTITNPTQFLLRSNDSITGEIEFNGVVVATLNSSHPTYVASAVGDYTIRLTGQCKVGRVYTSDVNDLSFVTQTTNIQDDCAGSLVPAEVNRRVSIVGTENTLNVRIVEQCDQNNDYESACASDDGRLILINTTVTPPELIELDGTPVPDGITAVACSSGSGGTSYVTVNKCFEDDTDPSIQYTQVVVYPVGDPGSSTVVWFDSTGSVVAEPANIQPCTNATDGGCGTLTASGIVCYDGGEDGTLQAFVFHDCEGNATYRDTITNAIVASPTIIDCPTSGGGGGGDDYEVVCASTDGRLLLLDLSSIPPTLTELDGSAIGDGATAVACAGDSGPLVDQTHVLSHGTDINVPAGMKSVTIVRLTGSPVVDGGFTLGDSPYPQSVTYNASEVVGARALLPAITIAGGTWQWTAVLPVAEE